MLNKKIVQWELTRFDLRTAPPQKLACLNRGAERGVILPIADSLVLPRDFKLIVPGGIEVYRVLGVKEKQPELFFATLPMDFLPAYLSLVDGRDLGANTGKLLYYPWHERCSSGTAFKRVTGVRGDPLFSLGKPCAYCPREHPLFGDIVR